MNARFHQTLVEAAANSALSDALLLFNRNPMVGPSSMVFKIANFQRLFECMRIAQREHEVLIGAISERQPSRAEALMSEHIYQSREAMRVELSAAVSDVPTMLRLAS